MIGMWTELRVSGFVRVTWNGKNLDEVTGWGLVTMEYPAYDVPVITRRNLDKIEYHQDGLD
jgi:hypothetical protein